MAASAAGSVADVLPWDRHQVQACWLAAVPVLLCQSSGTRPSLPTSRTCRQARQLHCQQHARLLLHETVQTPTAPEEDMFSRHRPAGWRACYPLPAGCGCCLPPQPVLLLTLKANQREPKADTPQLHPSLSLHSLHASPVPGTHHASPSSAPAARSPACNTPPSPSSPPAAWSPARRRSPLHLQHLLHGCQRGSDPVPARSRPPTRWDPPSGAQPAPSQPRQGRLLSPSPPSCWTAAPQA